MTPLQSWMMLLLAGIIAYLLAYIFNYFANFKLRKFYKSDLNRFQATKLLNAAYNYGLDCGYDNKTARDNAIAYCEELRKTNQLRAKYRMLRGA